MKQRKFAIVTDSGCDLSKDYLKEHDVFCVPLGFTFDGVNYGGDDGETMPTDEFYERLKKGGMPTTYQATPESVKGVLEPVLADGKDVLAVSFSSGLSGTEGSYRLAAKELSARYPDRQITVIDSLGASMGHGLLVDYAVKMADTGADLKKTAKYLDGLKGNIAHVFTVDNLYHLKRGGRVSGMTALIGTVLKIKPLMHVNDVGKLVAVQKCMGRKKALRAMMERIEQTQALEKGDPIFISHGACPEDAVQMQRELQEKYPDSPVTVGEIGPVIGTHSGVGTLAVFFKAKQR